MFKFLNTFREFFFQSENKNILLEMALGTREQMPINFDKEDLDFLYQFDLKDWPEAYFQRMNALGEALQRLEKNVKKDPEFQKTLNVKIDEEKPKYPNLSEEEIKSIVERKFYHDFTKDLNLFYPDSGAQDTQKMKFDFKKSYVNAYPHLNRLYHKLKTKIGEMHPENSGLNQKKDHDRGEYEFDLSDIVKNDKGRFETHGMLFPTITTIQKAIEGWISLNHHGAFGEIDTENFEDLHGNKIDPTQIRKMESQLGGNKYVSDVWIEDKLKRKILQYYQKQGSKNPKIEAETSLDDILESVYKIKNPEVGDDISTIRSILMRNLERFGIKEKIDNIPGKILKQGSKNRTTSNVKTILPHIKRTIEVVEKVKGKENVVKKDVYLPLLNNSEALIYNPEEDRYEKLYPLKYDPNKYRNRSIRGLEGGANLGVMQPNANIPSKHEHGTEEEIEKIFNLEAMKQSAYYDGKYIGEKFKMIFKNTDDVGVDKYRRDVLKGISQALNQRYGYDNVDSKSIRNKESEEIKENFYKNLILNDEKIRELHDFIVEEIKKNSSNPKLLKKDGISTFAYNQTGIAVQSGGMFEDYKRRLRNALMNPTQRMVRKERRNALRKEIEEMDQNVIYWEDDGTPMPRLLMANILLRYIKFLEYEVVSALDEEKKDFTENVEDNDATKSLVAKGSGQKDIREKELKDLTYVIDAIADNAYFTSFFKKQIFLKKGDSPSGFTSLGTDKIRIIAKIIEDSSLDIADRFEKWAKKMRLKGDDSYEPLNYNEFIENIPELKKYSIEGKNADVVSNQKQIGSKKEISSPITDINREIEPKKIDGKFNPRDLFSHFSGGNKFLEKIQANQGQLKIIYDNLKKRTPKLIGLAKEFHPEWDPYALIEKAIKIIEDSPYYQSIKEPVLQASRSPVPISNAGSVKPKITDVNQKIVNKGDNPDDFFSNFSDEKVEEYLNSNRTKLAQIFNSLRPSNTELINSAIKYHPEWDAGSLFKKVKQIINRKKD